MNDSPVVSEPDTPSAVRIRLRALLRWRVHGAETAAVALGTAAVGMQWARSGPSRWLTDDAGVALAIARSGDAVGDLPAWAGSPAWLRLLAPAGAGPGAALPGGWYAGALALLCFAGALYAATGTVRVLRGRRAWPYALAGAGVVALCPPALGRLFSGTGGALSLLVLAVTVRVIAGSAVRGRLASPGTAVAAGLLAGLGAGAVPAGVALGAVYPAALLLAGRGRGSGAAAVRCVAVHTAVWGAVCAVLWQGWPGSGTTGDYAAGVAVAGAGAVALGACAAGRAPVPVRLAAVAVGAVLLLPVAALPSAVAAALCGALLLAGRAPAGRVVGAAALAAAVASLWVGALGLAGGTLLAACAVATATACLLRSAGPRGRGGATSLLPPRRRATGAAWVGGAEASSGGYGTAGDRRRGRAPSRREGLPVPTPTRISRGSAPGPGRPKGRTTPGGYGTAGDRRRGRAPSRRGGPRTGRSVVVGVALVGSLVAGLGAQAGPPRAADALCFTEARYGRMFAGYAERLGLKRSTVALASPGGVLALGEQRVLDLRGRTDPHIAAARAAHDDAALRRYLFVRARPEFVHVDAAEAARTGLTAERLAAHGYRPLLRQGAGGDFVHRSAVTVPEAMPRLRAWARARVARLGDDGCAAPRDTSAKAAGRRG